MPAPISDNSGACSKSWTSWPALRRQQAAVSPPIPAPAIAILLAIVPAHTQNSGSFLKRLREVPLGNTARLPQFRTVGKVPTQPGAAMPVQFLDLGPGQAWHVTFHAIADCFLRICKVTIA